MLDAMSVNMDLEQDYDQDACNNKNVVTEKEELVCWSLRWVSGSGMA